MLDISIEVGIATAPPNVFGWSPGGALAARLGHSVDAPQPSVLFVDLLRKRGDRQVRIGSDPKATVPSFENEVIVTGRSLPRPIVVVDRRIRALGRNTPEDDRAFTAAAIMSERNHSA